MSSWSLCTAALRAAGRRVAASRRPAAAVSAPRRSVGAYDNDGKTYVSMLNNKNIGDGVMISGYTQHGFRLNNDCMVLGPVVCFANAVVAWRVDDEQDVCEDALAMLFHLEPPPSVVVLGVGDQTHRRLVDRVVLAASRRHRCQVDVLPVDAALATYNFAVSEGRHVAGAFIPPRFISAVDDDVINASARHMELYGDDLPREDVWRDDEEREQLINANYKEFAEVAGAQAAAEVELRAKLSKPRPSRRMDGTVDRGKKIE